MAAGVIQSGIRDQEKRIGGRKKFVCDRSLCGEVDFPIG